MTGQRKTITLSDFLTEAEMKLIINMWNSRVNERGFHIEVRDKIIRPNLKRINTALGQENDADYLAYMVEHVINEAERR